jgi:hypothetical protein
MGLHGVVRQCSRPLVLGGGLESRACPGACPGDGIRCGRGAAARAGATGGGRSGRGTAPVGAPRALFPRRLPTRRSGAAARGALGGRRRRREPTFLRRVRERLLWPPAASDFEDAIAGLRGGEPGDVRRAACVAGRRGRRAKGCRPRSCSKACSTRAGAARPRWLRTVRDWILESADSCGCPTAISANLRRRRIRLFALEPITLVAVARPRALARRPGPWQPPGPAARAHLAVDVSLSSRPASRHARRAARRRKIRSSSASIVSARASSARISNGALGTAPRSCTDGPGRQRVEDVADREHPHRRRNRLGRSSRRG